MERTEGLDVAWKWDARSHVWSYLEARNIARCPRPVYHRIPNFKNSDVAAIALSESDLFKESSSIAVGPENAQMKVRELVLEHNKTLYLPRPSLRDGFYSRIERRDISGENFAAKTTTSKMRETGTVLYWGTPFKIDLLVVGSVAVDKNTGARVGSGDGLAELEYGLLRLCGAVDEKTKIVTTVHDAQLQKMVPFGSMSSYDVPVDVIVTPTRIIFTEPSQSKPTGILWNCLSRQKLERYALLSEIKAHVEMETGMKLPTGPDEELPPRPYFEFGRGKRRRIKRLR